MIVTILLFRNASPLGKSMIALVIYPILVELFGTFLKSTAGTGKRIHPFYDHLLFFIYDAITNLFRRFLFNSSGSIEMTVILVILSGIEEVLVRSSVEWREIFFRKLTAARPLSAAEIREKRKFWAYSVNSSTIVELSSIIISSVMVFAFSNNRYFIDLGYSGNSEVNIKSLLYSMVMQIVIEMIVDLFCALIEKSQGVASSDFFFNLRNKEVVFIHILDFFIAVFWVIIFFRTIPNSVMCNDSEDPCSVIHLFYYYYIYII